jgi:hypothetical protein
MDKAIPLLLLADVISVTVAGFLYWSGLTTATWAVVILTMFSSATYRFFAVGDISYAHIILGLLVIPMFARGWWTAHQWEKKIRAAQRLT